MSSKLEAINRCLRAIGETPVNSIASELPEAADARSLIEEQTRAVLTTGWHTNTSYGIKLTPDVDGYIRVPNTYISIDSSGRSRSINVTARQDPNDGLLKLFNITDQTFKFTEPVYVDVVHYFDFDALPAQLQNYIAWRSAELFQQGSVAAIGLDAMIKANKAEAWSTLLDWEADADDTNILTGSYEMRQMTGRNNGYPR